MPHDTGEYPLIFLIPEVMQLSEATTLEEVFTGTQVSQLIGFTVRLHFVERLLCFLFDFKSYGGIHLLAFKDCIIGKLVFP